MYDYSTVFFRLMSQSSGLQTALVSLYDFSAHHKELQQSLDKERRQLAGLELAQRAGTLTAMDTRVALDDLKVSSLYMSRSVINRSQGY